jgi:hypothetical protein
MTNPWNIRSSKLTCQEYNHKKENPKFKVINKINTTGFADGKNWIIRLPRDNICLRCRVHDSSSAINIIKQATTITNSNCHIWDIGEKITPKFWI